MNLRAWWSALTESRADMQRARMGLDPAPKAEPWYDRASRVRPYRRARARRNAMANASRRRNR